MGCPLKRFYKTFTCSRHTQYAVVDDGVEQMTTVVRWTASETEVHVIAAVPYTGIGRGRAKQVAALVAEQLAASAPKAPDAVAPVLALYEFKAARADAERAGDCSVCGEPVRKHFDSHNRKLICEVVTRKGQ